MINNFHVVPEPAPGEAHVGVVGGRGEGEGGEEGKVTSAHVGSATNYPELDENSQQGEGEEGGGEEGLITPAHLALRLRQVTLH